MSQDTIKFKVVQDKVSKNVSLEIYRYDDNGDLVLVDFFNEMTVKELKELTLYLISLFKKNN